MPKVAYHGYFKLDTKPWSMAPVIAPLWPTERSSRLSCSVPDGSPMAGLRTCARKASNAGLADAWTPLSVIARSRADFWFLKLSATAPSVSLAPPRRCTGR